METFVTEKYEMILGGAKRFHLPEFKLQSKTQFLGCRYPDITATKNTILACDKRRQNHPTDRTILQLAVQNTSMFVQADKADLLTVQDL